MQLIHTHLESINSELDRREKSDDSEVRTPSSRDESDSDDEPISKQERNRRKRDEQKAQKEAERQWEEEQKRQREMYEEVLRRERQEMKQRKTEYKKQKKQRKRERQKTAKKFRDAKLYSAKRRQDSHQIWINKAVSRSKEDSVSVDSESPKNPIMEYNTNEIVSAIRKGDTDWAIELMHDEIGHAFETWMAKTFRNTPTDRCIELKVNDALRNQVLEDVLLAPLDEDKNNILHYAAYFRDDEMISYLVQESRRWERLEDFIPSLNVYGINAKDYAMLVQDTVIFKHIDRLVKEVDEVMESRRLGPTFRRHMARFGRAHSFMPLLLSVFGYLMGLVIFETGWLMSLTIVGIIMVHPSNSESTMSQDPRISPGEIARIHYPSILSGEIFSYHCLWLTLKMIHWGLVAILPSWISRYYFIYIPLWVISIPDNYHIRPIFKISPINKHFVIFLFRFITLPRRFPDILKTAVRLMMYIGLLLLIKIVSIEMWASLSAPTSPNPNAARSDSMYRALDTFNAAI